MAVKPKLREMILSHAARIDGKLVAAGTALQVSDKDGNLAPLIDAGCLVDKVEAEEEVGEEQAAE